MDQANGSTSVAASARRAGASYIRPVVTRKGTCTAAETTTLDGILREYQDESAGAALAVLCDQDGFDIAGSGASALMSRRKLASIASSVNSVVRAAGSQLQTGNSEVVTMTFPTHSLYVALVRTHRSDLLLSAMVPASQPVGHMLWSLKRHVARIQATFFAFG
jgi:predicted regulator of Ras-like GTPase activity (Roadblock/LC7/MglB family)